MPAGTPGSTGCRLLDPGQQTSTVDPALTEHQRCRLIIVGAFVPGTTTAAWFSAREAEYYNGRLRVMWITAMQDQTVIGDLLGSDRYLLQLPRSDEIIIGCITGGGATVEVDGVLLPDAAAYVATIDPTKPEPEAVGIECLYGD